MKHKFHRVAASLIMLPGAANANWSGWARCELNISGNSYQNRETHTWIVSNATNTAQGTGSWSAAGNGNLYQSDSVTTLRAEWAISANLLPGVRFGTSTPAAGQVRIRPYHSQLRQQNGITGYVQQTISGKARTPTTIAATEYEWSFPVVQGAANSQTISGSGAGIPAPGWGTMRASGTSMTVSCSWEFGNGYTPQAPPPVNPPATPVAGAQPPPGQPLDPCAPRAGVAPDSSAARIGGAVPNRPREGQRIVVCPR